MSRTKYLIIRHRTFHAELFFQFSFIFTDKSRTTVTQRDDDIYLMGRKKTHQFQLESFRISFHIRTNNTFPKRMREVTIGDTRCHKTIHHTSLSFQRPGNCYTLHILCIRQQYSHIHPYTY